MTEEIYDSFVKEQDLEAIEKWNTFIAETNENRIKNAESTEGSFGPLTKRKPGSIKVKEGVIKDGGKEVGKFLISGKGSYSHSFEVVNKEGITIGKAALILKENSGTMRTLTNNLIEKFHYKKTKDGKNPPNDEKFTIIAKFLIEQGYL